MWLMREIIRVLAGVVMLLSLIDFTRRLFQSLLRHRLQEEVPWLEDSLESLDELSADLFEFIIDLGA